MMENEECCICYENKNNKSQILTSCNHHFCLNCFLKHFKNNNNCPYCRNKILKDYEYKQLYNSDNNMNENYRNILWNIENFNNDNNILEYNGFNIENLVNNIIQDALNQ